MDLARKYNKSPEQMLILRRQLRLLADLGHISDQEFWIKILQAVGVKAVVEDCRIDLYEKAITGSIEIAKRLKQKGYCLAILSNDTKESSEVRRINYNFDQIFDELIYSYQLGLIKPDPEIFKVALKRLNAHPKQSLLIDDRIENIESSRNLGINSILFTHIDLLVEKLKVFGINLD